MTYGPVFRMQAALDDLLHHLLRLDPFRLKSLAALRQRS